MKRKIEENKSIINPEFKTSVLMTDRTISGDELISLLEKHRLSILSAMRRTHVLRGEEILFYNLCKFS